MATINSKKYNPHLDPPTSIVDGIRSIIFNFSLVIQMTKREVIGRYKGSIFGLAWSFFNPIIMLIVYTVVFSEIFKIRWSEATVQQSKFQFATILFVGLIVLNFFIEVCNRSPMLIVANVNFIKKVIFPIEILSVVAVTSALFHALVSLVVLALANYILNQSFHWTLIFLPLIFLPLILIALGASWLLSSIGVFVRDLSQSINILMTILTFVSPVFYPVSAVPSRFRPLLFINPVTFIIEQLREIILSGNLPDWSGLVLYFTIAFIIFWIGFLWFQKTRKGFADVL